MQYGETLWRQWISRAYNIKVSALLVPVPSPVKLLIGLFERGKFCFHCNARGTLRCFCIENSSAGTLVKEDARSLVAALARESEWIDVNVHI